MIARTKPSASKQFLLEQFGFLRKKRFRTERGTIGLDSRPEGLKTVTAKSVAECICARIEELILVMGQSPSGYAHPKVNAASPAEAARLFAPKARRRPDHNPKFLCNDRQPRAGFGAPLSPPTKLRAIRSTEHESETSVHQWTESASHDWDHTYGPFSKSRKYFRHNTGAEHTISSPSFVKGRLPARCLGEGLTFLSCVLEFHVSFRPRLLGARHTCSTTRRLSPRMNGG